VLALIAERISGAGFHQLVAERVCRPAGMATTEFLRNAYPPANARQVPVI
jgi:CubicO group peptidase (beta-lactamase class C family)